VTYFKDMAIGGVHIITEFSEKILIKRETRGELKKDGPDLFSQVLHGLVKPLQRLFRIPEAFGMGNIFIPFDGPKETFRRSFIPIPKGFGVGKSIERGIDLHRIKMIRIEFKPLVLRETRRVKDIFPMRIVPSRRADSPL